MHLYSHHGVQSSLRNEVEKFPATIGFELETPGTKSQHSAVFGRIHCSDLVIALWLYSGAMYVRCKVSETESTR